MQSVLTKIQLKAIFAHMYGICITYEDKICLYLTKYSVQEAHICTQCLADMKQRFKIDAYGRVLDSFVVSTNLAVLTNKAVLMIPPIRVHH